MILPVNADVNEAENVAQEVPPRRRALAPTAVTRLSPAVRPEYHRACRTAGAARAPHDASLLQEIRGACLVVPTTGGLAGQSPHGWGHAISLFGGDVVGLPEHSEDIRVL